MGMWDRDANFGIRLDLTVSEDEPFLLLEIAQDEPFVHPTQLDKKTGKNLTIETRTKMLIRKLDESTLKPYGVPVEVKTLSGPIYTLAGEFEEGDLPAVVVWKHVVVSQYDTEAMVLQRVCMWPVPPEYLTMGETQDVISPPETPALGTGEEDVLSEAAGKALAEHTEARRSRNRK